MALFRVYLNVCSIKYNKKYNIYKSLSAIFLSAVILFAAMLTVGCGDKSDHLSVNLLGASVNLYLVNEMAVAADTKKDINKTVKDLADRINNAFSVEGDSPVYAFNGQSGKKSVAVDGDIKYVFDRAKDLYQLTDGAFNPALKPLVDLWGFSARYQDVGYTPKAPFDRERLADGGFSLPDQRYVDGFRLLADFSRISLKTDGAGYSLTADDWCVTVDGEDYYQALDFSALLKGYFTDLVKDAMEGFSIDGYYVTAGGSSLYLGNVNGGDWDLTVVDPFSAKREGILSVKVKDKFVSTSGTYENFYDLDGTRYCHIIDGKTGAPTQSDVASCTIICDDGLLSDGLSTALVVMGSQRAQALLKDYPEVSYILILSDGSVLSNVEEDITFLK